MHLMPRRLNRLPVLLARSVVPLFVIVLLAAAGLHAADSPDPSVETILAALSTLETTYVEPVQPVPLLNVALDALRAPLALDASTVPPIPASTPESQARAAFSDEFQTVVRATNMPSSRIATIAVVGMLASLHDSHTSFLTAAQFAESQRELSGEASYAGTGMAVGVVKGPDGTSWPVAMDVFPGGPAAKAGLARLDIIAAVDGVSTANADVTQVANELRGQPATQVLLTIHRGGRTLNVGLVRSKVSIPAVWSRTIGGDVLVIRLYEFADDASLGVRRAIMDDPQRPRAIVLDLRGDPGGYLDEARLVAGIFVPNGSTIGYVQQRGGGLVPLRSQGIPVYAGPLTILIDQGTASSAEIIASAMKDLHRATLVGDTSAGALGGAETVGLPGGAMSVTVLRIVAPQHEQIEGVGVAPDLPVALTGDNILSGQDSQLQRALESAASQ
jgi:carboxyl-terminal processing protease